MPDASDPQILRVAAVQAASVFLDREATTAKACALIRQAGREGAQMVVFPEGFIPGHASWYHHHVATGPLSTGLALRLFESSVEIPGPVTQALGEAAREAGCLVVMGLCEREPGSRATMWNSQVFIGPDGKLLGKHRKFMPTVGERLVHVGGHGDTFGAVETPLGRVSGLVCGENLNPLAQFALTAERTTLHAMSWPAYFGLGGPAIGDLVRANAVNFALSAGAFVVAACGALDAASAEAMAIPEADMATLEAGGRLGGSLIAAPSGQILAGPMGAEEGLLLADCDLSLIGRVKLAMDFAGHYHRPDIFSLSVNRRRPEPVTYDEDPPAPSEG